MATRSPSRGISTEADSTRATRGAGPRALTWSTEGLGSPTDTPRGAVPTRLILTGTWRESRASTITGILGGITSRTRTWESLDVTLTPISPVPGRTLERSAVARKLPAVSLAQGSAKALTRTRTNWTSPSTPRSVGTLTASTGMGLGKTSTLGGFCSPVTRIQSAADRRSASSAHPVLVRTESAIPFRRTRETQNVSTRSSFTKAIVVPIPSRCCGERSEGAGFRPRRDGPGGA